MKMIFLLLFEMHDGSKVYSIIFSFSSFNPLDYHAEPWQINHETGKRERLCTYKVTVAAVFGSATVCSHERQVKPHEQNVLFH